MSSFIDTSIGLVNLQHILFIKPGRQPDELDTLETVEGRSLRCRVYNRDIIRGEDGPLVPASAGLMALTMWVDDEGTVCQEQDLIIAWRDKQGYLAPVFRQELCDNQRAFLEIAGGFQELTYDGLRYHTLDDAKGDMLHRWDPAPALGKTAVGR